MPFPTAATAEASTNRSTPSSPGPLLRSTSGLRSVASPKTLYATTRSARRSSRKLKANTSKAPAALTLDATASGPRVPTADAAISATPAAKNAAPHSVSHGRSGANGAPANWCGAISISAPTRAQKMLTAQRSNAGRSRRRSASIPFVVAPRSPAARASDGYRVGDGNSFRIAVPLF